jgi:hypothetical protein
MKEITLHIPDEKYRFIMELLKSLGYVTIVKADDGDSKKEIIKNLKEACEEMKLIRSGKKSARNPDDFLKEL